GPRHLGEPARTPERVSRRGCRLPCHHDDDGSARQAFADWKGPRRVLARDGEDVPCRCAERRLHLERPGAADMIGTADGVRQRDKLLTMDDLPRLRERFRDRRIVHCHGAFDLVHIGHLIHFEEARSLGDILVVTITADQHITKKRAVTFTQEHRARQVAALEMVDYVAIIQEPTALSAIEALHPDVYVKGPEYADLTLDRNRSIYHEMRVLEGYGGRIHFTSGETFSPTKVSHLLLASPDAAQRNPLLRNDRVLFRDISARGLKP